MYTIFCVTIYKKKAACDKQKIVRYIESNRKIKLWIDNRDKTKCKRATCNKIG